MTLNQQRKESRKRRATGESPTEAYLLGHEQPAALQSVLAKKHGKWAEPLTEQQTAVAILEQPPETAIAEVMDRFVAVMPEANDLPLKEQVKLAQLVGHYNLQPAHIHIQDYSSRKGGKSFALVITYAGRLYCAEQALGVPFSITSRAMTADERRDNQIPDGQSANVSSFKKLIPGVGMVETNTGIGRAGIGKDDGASGGQRNPVAMAHAPEMADTRSKRRVLDEAVPLGVRIPVRSAGGVIDSEDFVVIDEPVEMEALPALTDPVSDVAAKDALETLQSGALDGEPFREVPETQPRTQEQVESDVLLLMTALAEMKIDRADIQVLKIDAMAMLRAGIPVQDIATHAYAAKYGTEPLGDEAAEEEMPW
jgi:hypothetical protein